MRNYLYIYIYICTHVHKNNDKQRQRKIPVAANTVHLRERRRKELPELIRTSIYLKEKPSYQAKQLKKHENVIIW